ncbi:MAG TPA: aminofutalosine synthase MqnE [Bacteroidia bacterium]|nr:aminofutalosine synthase MqnE [Bacteroidia bacterium]
MTLHSDFLFKPIDHSFHPILEKVIQDQRLNEEEGLRLYHCDNLAWLGQLANFSKQKRHGMKVYFNRNFHIEPTNVCIFSCNFCSYSESYKNKEEGWELSHEEMMNIVKSYDDKSVTEVHIVGGVHPKLNLDFFCQLICDIKNHRPELHIKAFTAVELDYMFKKAKRSVKEGLTMLRDSGLNSLPGGGAEIFDEDVRTKICNDKCSAEQWLHIHKTAHELGIHSNATMLYGHIESYEHRIDHMLRLRNLQDLTSGFNTFIPLKFRNKNNDMSHISECSLIEDLKNYAVARLFMDNFSHLKAYWPMIGRQTAQLALSYGVDDIDGTIDDSTKIYTRAGAEEQSPKLTTEEITNLIRSAKFTPVERDTLYEEIKTY